MVRTEVWLLLWINALNSLESSESLQDGIPTNTVRAIHRCDITPWTDAEITSYSVWAFTSFTDYWDDAAFINIYPKRKGHRIISRALEHTVLKRKWELFWNLLSDSDEIIYCWCLHTANNFCCHLMEASPVHSRDAPLQRSLGFPQNDTYLVPSLASAQQLQCNTKILILLLSWRKEVGTALQYHNSGLL